MSKNQEMMTTAEAAEYLGVKEHTLEVWRSAGRYRLPYLKIGDRTIRYRRSHLDEWLKRRTVK